MADNSSDAPGGRPARPALPPFRGPGAPANATPGAKPAAARPAFPPGGRATVPPFAAPTGASRRSTPAVSPAVVRQSTPPRALAAPEAATPAASVVAPGAPVDELPSSLVESAEGSSPGWLTADTAVRGEFGDLVEHRPIPAALPPALPTPPMPWPAVTTDGDAAGLDAGWDELTAEFEPVGGGVVQTPPDVAPDADAPGDADDGSDAWSRGYEAEAAALLGDEPSIGAESDAAVDAASYLADDGEADPTLSGTSGAIHPSMMPTPVVGVPSVDGTTWSWPEETRAHAGVDDGVGDEGDDVAYGVAPPDPLLADAMRDAEEDAGAWSDPLADEPLGGDVRERPAGAYGAATPYMVPAHEYGTASAYGAPDADAVAEALERVAAWVRSGELPVSVPPAQELSEAQALTAALAALLGLGAQR